MKELLSQGADPNLPLTRGLGTALCVVCDLAYEQQRTTDNKIALVRGNMGGCWGRGGRLGPGLGRLDQPKITSGLKQTKGHSTQTPISQCLGNEGFLEPRVCDLCE